MKNIKVNFVNIFVEAPESIDATRMTSDEIHEKLNQGYNDYLEGKTHKASTVFKKFREKQKKS